MTVAEAWGSCCPQTNGLLMSNSWAGYHVLLNPDYSAATQWRFVNRAIDEVENDRVQPLSIPRSCLPTCLPHRTMQRILTLFVSMPMISTPSASQASKFGEPTCYWDGDCHVFGRTHARRLGRRRF